MAQPKSDANIESDIRLARPRGCEVRNEAPDPLPSHVTTDRNTTNGAARQGEPPDNHPILQWLLLQTIERLRALLINTLLHETFADLHEKRKLHERQLKRHLMDARYST